MRAHLSILTHIAALFLAAHHLFAFALRGVATQRNTQEVEHDLAIIIGSHHSDQSVALRQWCRDTWLKFITSPSMQHKITYNFFVLSLSEDMTHQIHKQITNENEINKDIQVVQIQPGHIPPNHCLGEGVVDRMCRHGSMGYYQGRWTLQNTSSKWILMTEHDGFVNLPLLLQTLSQPHYAGMSKNLVMGYWWSSRRPSPDVWKRYGDYPWPDGNFVVFSRPVFELTIAEFANEEGQHERGFTFDLILGRILCKNRDSHELQLLNENERIESQQGWHTSHRFTRPFSAETVTDLCSRYLFVHVMSKEVGPISEAFARLNMLQRCFDLAKTAGIRMLRSEHYHNC